MKLEDVKNEEKFSKKDRVKFSKFEGKGEVHKVKEDKLLIKPFGKDNKIKHGVIRGVPKEKVQLL